jgi:hypothetical protein
MCAIQRCCSDKVAPHEHELITALLGLERVAGIEPAPSAWKAEVLPLNYTRQSEHRIKPAICRRYASTSVVEGVGFEPTKA